MDYITDDMRVVKINEFLEQGLGFLWYAPDTSDRRMLVRVEMHLVGTEPTYLAVGVALPPGTSPSKAAHQQAEEVSRPLGREELAALYAEMCERRPQWLRLNASDVMPCRLCNGHYAWLSQYSRGIQYEPVAGQGTAFLCWECCHALYEQLFHHFTSMAYTFLASKGTVRESRRQQLSPARPQGLALLNALYEALGMEPSPPEQGESLPYDAKEALHREYLRLFAAIQAQGYDLELTDDGWIARRSGEFQEQRTGARMVRLPSRAAPAPAKGVDST